MQPPKMTLFFWSQRIERAKQLTGTYPFASEILNFYQEIAAFQKELYESLVTHNSTQKQNAYKAIASTNFEPTFVLSWFPRLLELVRRVGPVKVAQTADALAQKDSAQWKNLIESCWNHQDFAGGESDSAEPFLARALLQPCAELLAAQTDPSWPGYEGYICPFCNHKPQMGVLRPEGYGARRSLVCSLCLTEWSCRRILCPSCEEDSSDRLTVYTGDQFEHVRIEACETCKAYIKTIDLTKNGLAVPIVDEIATSPLDLWARAEGYQKLTFNLLGL
ncbi:MAG: formate dehydrogenase accessory protein FdhE [Acidobacteria bacterium]|nr:formate dehydrogenase accessory protein FdhE [Acidobacteriota bacterium]